MHRKAVRRTLCFVLLACPALGAVGCYTRTVEAKGVGAKYREETIYEPNLKFNKDEGDTAFDGAGDLLLGPRRIEERR